MTCIYILKINNNNIGYYFNYDLARDFLYSCYYANFIKDTDKVVIETFKQNTNIKIHSENIYFTISTNTKLDTNSKLDNDLESFSNSSNSTKTSCSFKDNILSEDESETDSDQPDTNYISSEFESDSTIASVESTFSEFMKKRDDNKKKNKLMNDIGQEKIDVTYHINLLKQEKKKIQEKENEYNYDLELYKKFKELKGTNNNFKVPELFVNKYNIFLKLEDSNELSFDNFIILYQPEVISTDYDSMFSAPSHYKLEAKQKNNQIIEEIEELDQTYEQLEELDQTYEQLNKKYDNLVKIKNQEEITKKCETFVEESYDNLFMVSHNLSSKPENSETSDLNNETETESESDSDSEYEIKTESE